MNWLPIETAPKDGTRIFVTGRKWQYPSVAYWHEGQIPGCTCWGVGLNGVQGWIDASAQNALLGRDHDLMITNATHWMPIPPYPTVEPT